MVKLTDTARLWLALMTDWKEMRTQIPLRLWLIGSGEVLAACLDGRTGYVVVGFRA